MGFFNKIFGGGDGEKPAPRPSVDVEKLAASLAAPAVHLVPAASATPCYFGGEPTLPAGVAWPAKDGQPLTFLAAIDLPSIAEVLAIDWLPPTGRLLFFYEAEGQPWGFDPKDRGGWAVIHAQDAGASTTPPDLARTLPRRFVSPRRIASPPSYERPEVEALKLSEGDSEALIEFGIDLYGDAPKHQIGGYPQPIQGDGMELECQTVSHGIYAGEPSAYEDPRAKALEEGARDWRLLLQVDSDGSIDVMWGDAGMIYFWVREQDARAGRFENVWLVLQCH
jgi:uncharacterized protein YwqG